MVNIGGSVEISIGRLAELVIQIMGADTKVMTDPQRIRPKKNENEYLDFPDLVIRLLENTQKVLGFESDAYWLDIGRHDDYAEAQKKFEGMKDSFLPRA